MPQVPPVVPPIPFERIKNVASGLYVTVGTTDDGEILSLQGDDPTNPGQQWLRIGIGDPRNATYKFKCRKSSKVVDARGGNLERDVMLQQFLDKSLINEPNTNQLWKLVHPDDDPGSYFIHAEGSELLWTVLTDRDDERAADQGPGASILLFPLSDPADPGDYGQRWAMEPTDGVAQAFAIVSRGSGGLVLDLPNSALFPGSVQVFEENLGFNQLWQLDQPANRYFTIRSVCTGQVVNNPGGNLPPDFAVSADVIQSNDTVNQQWQIKATGDWVNDHPVVTLVSVVDERLLDSLGGGESTAVEIRPDSRSLNQKWILVPWSDAQAR